jgi:uncharacterized membrane protein
MKKTNLIIFLIILISFAIGAYLYPSMPYYMASHWDARGNVDAYGPKCWTLFFMPFFSLFLWLLYIIIPKIDPLKENIEKFRKYYDWFFILITVFFLYVHLLSLSWNLGLKFDMSAAMIPALSLLFFYCGILIEHSQRNWFVGIRTPWTLSSETVWQKTSRVGARFFKILAVFFLASLFFPEFPSILAMILLLPLFVIFLVVYSYLEYRKEKK